MSDKDLRLQVVLNAVDKLTRPVRTARASTRELADSLRTARASLKDLDAQAARIDGFRKARSQLAITANNLKGAREEAAAGDAVQRHQPAHRRAGEGAGAGEEPRARAAAIL